MTEGLSIEAVKKALVAKAKARLMARIEELSADAEGMASSRNDQTKSSAGDKHETGRALLQAELDRILAQLAKTRQLQARFNQIDFEKHHTKADTGSLVYTTSGFYLLATGLGKFEVEGTICQVISPGSPIGQSLQGMGAGQVATFRTQSMRVIDLL